MRETPLARFFPTRVIVDQEWDSYALAMHYKVQMAQGPLRKVQNASSLADRCATGGLSKGVPGTQRFHLSLVDRRSAGTALDVHPSWHPGGALRIPAGLLNWSVPLNDSRNALHLSRVGVGLYRGMCTVQFGGAVCLGLRPMFVLVGTSYLICSWTLPFALDLSRY